MTNRKQYLGLLIIVLAVVFVILYQVFKDKISLPAFISGPKVQQTVDGYIGGEKEGFFKDPQVIKILHDKYGLTVNAVKKGSLDMVNEDYTGKDYLFPSSKIALEIYKTKNNGNAKAATIFYSPIVVYSWKSLLPDLINMKLVQTDNNAYTLDLTALVNDVNQSKTWEQLGGKTLKGKISISSTDPTRSNSGNMFAGMVGTILAVKGDVVNLTNLTPEKETELKNFFAKMGYMDSSSADMFAKFLNLGRSSFPFVVGYENQLIEVINKNNLDTGDIVMLYPNPTTWSEHELIALTDKGQLLSDALANDPELMNIGWQTYGFRKYGTIVDTNLYSNQHIAKDVNNVIPMPNAQTMQRIISVLSTN
jgi:hypothetical protein